MKKRPYDLLEKMRHNKMSCRPDDLHHLYRGFDFQPREGHDHTIYTHRKYRDIRGTVGRHTFLTIGYYSTAVRLVDEVLAREKQEQARKKGKGRDDDAT
jgi:hypothetical protein